jgi:AraC family transcriptional activator of pyochelin receptor
MSKHRIDVSPEMISFVGAGPVDRADWPLDAFALLFHDLDGGASLLVAADASPAELAGAALVLAVSAPACRRIFGFAPDDGGWHLSAAPRAIALALRDCPLPEPARGTLRLAKSLELLCAVMAAMGDDALVPADSGGILSEGDAVRVVAARRLIDERWREKLTLDGIARACGLNRAKLTRGFRLTFGCSVADALAENRLGGARRMLLATDLPVSSVGYACGYLNNASFTRAFSRRFGMAPTHLRQAGVTA